VSSVYHHPIPLELDEDVVLHRLSLDEYHRLIDAGAFEDRAPFELIDGVLVAMSLRSAEHEEAIGFLNAAGSSCTSIPSATPCDRSAP